MRVLVIDKDGTLRAYEIDEVIYDNYHKELWCENEDLAIITEIQDISEGNEMVEKIYEEGKLNITKYFSEISIKTI